MTKPRDLFDMGSNLEVDDDESYNQCTPSNVPSFVNTSQMPSWRRLDIEEEEE